jgi:6-phosphogluconolactonase
MSRSLPLDGARRRPLVLAATLLALAACADASTTAPAVALRADADAASHGAVGGVFTTTNGATENAVVAFARAADGSLTLRGTYATGGRGIGGTADPLQSQFALTLSRDAHWLFVANAGSDDVSAFRVAKDGLTLVGRAASGGTRPVSVAVSHDVVYVLNAVSGDIGILRVGNDGSLALVGTRDLGAGSDGAAAIRVSPDGQTLAVTKRVSRTIEGIAIARDGMLGAPIATPSAGVVPFGFDYTPRGQIVVSEAGSGSASSYDQARDGALALVSGPISTAGQRAPCWLIVDPSGRFAYTANAGSASITGYSIASNGALALLTPGGLTGDLGAGAQPLDLDMSRDGRFLYVFENGTGTIGAFAVDGSGNLAALPDTPGLVARGGYMGLAAY